MTGLRQIQCALARRTHAARQAPLRVPANRARLAGGGPSASREMSMKNWPIRQRLFGCIAGAPNGVRRGWADRPIPWRQAQRAVPQGRKNRHQAQQKKTAPVVSGNGALDAYVKRSI